MPSRTSFFNKTVYRKDLTRFTPVWGSYLLILMLGLFLIYTNGSNDPVRNNYLFIQNVVDMIRVMGVVNLFYALVTAQLLFGDLYNARSCHMLHALPLRRESWFVTHVLAGLTFSVVPTGITSLLILPLLSDTIITNASAAALGFFLGSNLEYLCFFGMAVFCAMCVGNRLTMVAGYGLLNAGAYLTWFLVDLVYTPMLYGVVTPTRLADTLTPVGQMSGGDFLRTGNWSDLLDEAGNLIPGAASTITLGPDWPVLGAWALAGIGFLAAAVLLYRRRDLECAGDAVAFPCLVPVFQVFCAAFVMVAGQGVLYLFLGMRERNLPVMTVGLVAGWFIGKMLLERTTRVFRLKNWYGLAALTAVLAVSLVLTHFDVLGIEKRLPDANRVEWVTLNSNYGGTTINMEDPQDIAAMIRLQELAIRKPLDRNGTYVLQPDGEYIPYSEAYGDQYDEEWEVGDYAYVSLMDLTYKLDNGNTIRRSYYIFTHEEAGRIASQILNRWENVDNRYTTIDGVRIKRLPHILNDFDSMDIGYLYTAAENEAIQEKLRDKTLALELVEALKADAAEGHLAQNELFHNGHFILEREASEKGLERTASIHVSINGRKNSWGLQIYADSAHTIHFLQSHGLLPNVEVSPENIRLW